MQRVQAGHHEVQREEDLRVPEMLGLELEAGARHVVLDELVVVLDALDAENAAPRTIVSTRNISSCRRSPVCAACTASAIVRLLVMSTTVLMRAEHDVELVARRRERRRSTSAR